MSKHAMVRLSSQIDISQARYRIRYVRDGKRHPVGCIVYGQPGIGTPSCVAWSAFNPKDRFDKKIAREVALGRFLTHPVMLDMRGCTKFDNALALTKHGRDWYYRRELLVIYRTVQRCTNSHNLRKAIQEELDWMALSQALVDQGLITENGARKFNRMRGKPAGFDVVSTLKLW